ncbi:endo-alpha-N-acetylgalactosaminidase family protein [Bifidobacterium samirii]|uniref:Endo-alpha-N-acetylgalactosaminidase n=1 Tax=Bifidobacterium samirii TaxID=2306974 RepID=A0A430FUT7_9BIFI|nr:endo-alpha-N-acetylgalactosaminidase family protein [Bifidobacterium samirii]RSX56995.1 Endo-alpha-N-acetylgalactosaminidase [Bifidobacterium samirii]
MNKRIASVTLAAALVVAPMGVAGVANAEPLLSQEMQNQILQVLQEGQETTEATTQADVSGWTVDSSIALGGEILEEADGWVHFKSNEKHGNAVKNPSENNNWPAVAIADQTFDFTKAGQFHATLRSPQEPSDNRFGFYLGYKDPGNGLFIGFDTGGWFWQKYENGDGAWYSGDRIAAPAANAETDVLVSWTDDHKVTLTVDGQTAFTEDFSSMGNLSDKVAMKAGSWKNFNDVTDMYVKDFPEADTSVYDVAGNVWHDKGVVAGATVRIGDKTATTDAKGNFSVTGLKNGKYTLSVSAEGYEDASQEVVINGSSQLALQVRMTPAAVVETETLATEQMTVALKKHFPSVLSYTMSDGKVMHGQSRDVRTVEINGTNVELTDDDVTFKKDGDTKATYVLTVKNEAKHVDAVVTVEIGVEKNTLHMDVTKIENKADEDKYPIQTISFPNHSLVSVRADQTDAQFTGARMSSDTNKPGDTNFGITDSLNKTNDDYTYAFVSGGGLSAGLWSNSEHDGSTASGTVAGGAKNTRVYATTQSVSGVTSLGLASAPWYYHRTVTDSKGRSYAVEETDMPKMAVAIAGDQNEDGTVNWQDGAIAYRSIMNNPYKSEEVPELVAWRIAMNFGGQAQNPFLTTLDNVKKVALNTDGLGQSVLLKGYGNEGHDSGHPDYADIGERIGGADDMNELMEKGAEYGARFGIHVNASEMYPEAKAFNEDMVRRNSSGGLSYGWNWLDQGVGIDGIYDLASGSRESRFDALSEKVGDNMDFIYLDVWGNNTSGAEDSWETRKMSQMINDNGWRMTTEWGAGNEYDSTFQHWAADLTYGGSGMKGENSQVMRFLRNHQKDSWVGDYPSYGGAANAPLLGGYNMKDFEGWQGRNDYAAYITNLYTHDVSTKFIQHFKVTQWVNSPLDATSTQDASVNNGNEQITLKDDNGNTLVLSRGSNDTSNAAYRDRTITLNGVTVATGAVSRGDNGTGGTESYLLPWMWDASTGELLGSDDQRLYHWNTTGGETTWTLPTGWENLSSVKVYQLTDQGKTDEQDVAVVNGQVTLSADAQTPYVVYKGEAKQIQVNWSDGMHVVDAGFNGGQATLKDNWTVTGNGTAEVEGTNNAMLRLTGKVSVSQKITDLKAGERYALYLGVDNRTAGDASVTVTDGGTTLASNSTGTSIAKNYIKAYAHNTNTNTEAGSSYFQNMYVWFTAPESGTAEVTLSLKSDDAEHAYFDDVRILENAYDGIVSEADGTLKTLTNDFENNAQGIWPFVISGIEGVEDNRTHLSELHAPYTQAGWDVKKMDDVLDGDWSVKINGLAGYGTLAYQTIPQNVKFEAGEQYKVSFDYQSGSDDIYAVAIGQGEFNAASTEFQNLKKALGEDGHYEFTLTGGINGDSWFGIYSTSTAADTQGTSGNAANFGGYKDFVLDNLTIEHVESESHSKADAQAKLDEVTGKYDGRRSEYSDAAWRTYHDTIAEARVMIDRIGATEADFTKAYNILSALDEYMATAPGNESSDKYDVATEGAYTVSTGSEEPTAGLPSEGPASLAQDGAEGTHWHTSWSQNAVGNGTAWYEFNLTEPTDINGLRYLPRAGAANANGKIKGYTIEVETAAGTVTTAAEGEFSTTTMWQKAKFDTVKDAVRVRLTVKTSAGQSESQANKFASAAELRLTTDREVAEETIPVDTSELEELVTKAEALQEKDYSADSWKAFAEARDYGRKVLDRLTGDTPETSDDDAYEVGLASANLRTTMAALERVTPDYAALDAVIAKADALVADAYTEETWQAMQTALADAKAVRADENANQSAIDKAAETLTKAIDALEKAEPKPDPEPGTVDKTKLEQAIAKADALKKADYTEASWNALTTALDKAKATLADENADQTAVDQALKGLQDAIAGLKAAGTGTGDNKPGPSQPSGKPSTKPGKPANTGASIATAVTAGFVLLAGAGALTIVRRRRLG